MKVCWHKKNIRVVVMHFIETKYNHSNQYGIYYHNGTININLIIIK